MNTAGILSFVPINKEMEIAYGANRLTVNYLGTIFMLLCIPGNFIAIFVIENKGIRTTMTIGTVL
jgi:hypothetical protein